MKEQRPFALARSIMMQVVLAGVCSPADLPAPAHVSEGCYLGGCDADWSSGGGAALSLLQAKGNSRAAAVAGRHLHVRQHAEAAHGAAAGVGGARSELQQFQDAPLARAAVSRVRGTPTFAVNLLILLLLGLLFAILAIITRLGWNYWRLVQPERKASEAGSPRDPRLRGLAARKNPLLLGSWSGHEAQRGAAALQGSPASMGFQPVSSAERLLPSLREVTPAITPASRPRLQSPMVSPSPGHSGAATPLAQGTSEVEGVDTLTIVVPRPLPGGKLGLKFTDDTLEMIGFTDEQARQFGFTLGDRILQVNGTSVTRQEDFVIELQQAMEMNRLQGSPIAFSVRRTQLPLQVSPSFGPAGLVGSVGMLGTWAYCDDRGKYPYQITEEASGMLLRFTQQLPPPGGVVSGKLVPQGRWHQGVLTLSNGLQHGTVRLRYDPERRVMISRLMVHGEEEWGEEIVAQRQPEPASRSSSFPAVPAAAEHHKAARVLPFATVPSGPTSQESLQPSGPQSQESLRLPYDRVPVSVSQHTGEYPLQ